MAERSWFFASDGQQQGPYGESQLREFIARRIVVAETLVWTEGMSDWQKAGDVPGLITNPSAPGEVPRPRGATANTAGYGDGQALSIDFEILEFTWRSLVLLVGLVLIIPAPWAIVWYVNWMLTRVRVPGRPNLSFAGEPLTMAYWYFGAIIVAVLAAVIIRTHWLDHLINLGQFVLYWLFLRWFIANLVSNGHQLGLGFSGSVWAFLGWSILAVISVVTIVGWAWVYVAQMRWICRNIQGTRRQVVFKGTGLECLWRMIVAVIASFFIIPIPWMYRWMMGWFLSQTELVSRT